MWDRARENACVCARVCVITRGKQETLMTTISLKPTYYKSEIDLLCKYEREFIFTAVSKICGTKAHFTTTNFVLLNLSLCSWLYSRRSVTTLFYTSQKDKQLMGGKSNNFGCPWLSPGTGCMFDALGKPVSLPHQVYTTVGSTRKQKLYGAQYTCPGVSLMC